MMADEIGGKMRKIWQLIRCEVGEVTSKEGVKDHPGVKMKSNSIIVRNRGVGEGLNW